MLGSVRETFSNVRDALLDIQEQSEGPPGFPGEVGRPSRISGRGRRPILMSGSAREALLDLREWSDSTSGCPGVVGRPSRLFGSGRETLPNVRDALLDFR